MAFLKRLGFYLVGLSIGLVFLAFFFKKKSEETGIEFCYFPNCRTLKDIRSKSISYSDKMQVQLENMQMDSTDIAHFLNDGDVDFEKSDTKSKLCKTYIIEGEVKGKKAVLKVKNCKNEATIENISFSQ